MDQQQAADFVRRFEEYWRSPRTADLGTVLAERAHLTAPLTPTVETRAEGARGFAELLELIPDLGVEVHRWGATADGVLIEFTMGGTVAGGPISWDVVDRFVVGDDGLATERVTYFDSAQLARAVARRPRAWPAFLRSRLPRRR
jgi:ketosteroid isomerase-like protein